MAKKAVTAISSAICSSALNVLEVYGLFILCGWKKEEMKVDIVPLIETIDDLQKCFEYYENLI